MRSEKADQLILQIWSIDASCGDLDCEFPILWAAVPETGWSRSSVIEERARRTRRDAVQAPGPEEMSYGSTSKSADNDDLVHFPTTTISPKSLILYSQTIHSQCT